MSGYYFGPGPICLNSLADSAPASKTCRTCRHGQDSHTEHGCRDCNAYELCYGFHPHFIPTDFSFIDPKGKP